jgi:hypothetical protein
LNWLELRNDAGRSQTAGRCCSIPSFRFIDEQLSEKFGRVDPRKELAVDGWIELTRQGKQVLDDIVRDLDDSYRLPPNCTRQ